ncbi:3'-5' exonuclease [Kocuria flava]|uniref:3'-5' exonuclease n=1 Tax=Kocuria flava TaxID=446860 RepID=UPI001FF68F40|nr:3'-5' exonuclease [Kocuria flava]MCJ8504985.1 3'-5' exonuclease [Kocuria flava]
MPSPTTAPAAAPARTAGGPSFTAIDFETANRFPGSPCAVGLVRVRDGVVVEERSAYMRPPRTRDGFDPGNVRVHGITARTVAGHPRFEQLWPRIEAWILAEDPGELLVAHNARFDMGVIRAACAATGTRHAPLSYACSLALARRGYELASYALPRAAEAAGVPLGRHHDALEDARACAGVVVDLVRRAGAVTVPEALAGAGLAVRRLEPLPRS